MIVQENNVFSKDNVATLRSKVKGKLLQPGDAQYEEAAKAWNLAAQQHPLLVLMAEGAEDIKAAVQFASDANIGVAVMATGHGVGIVCDGGLLINTSRMRAVQIDTDAKTAKVEAGALWKDVNIVAHPHGLTGLAGSASHVGVVGYTLGGGYGYLGRKHGLNSSSVIAADIVTADGKLMHVSADENEQLFWAVKGSVGNMGIVVSLEFRLYPLTHVFGGAVFYPFDQAQEVFELYAEWTSNLPDEMTTAFAFMNVPPLPFLPEPIRGKSVVVIKGCYCGDDPAKGEELFNSVRNNIQGKIMDTFRTMPVSEMDTISNDPLGPLAVLQYGNLINDLSDEAIDVFMKLTGPQSPVTIIEFRRLGGALQKQSQDISLLGSGNARYSMNALGVVFSQEVSNKINAYFDLLADKTRPFQTGESFINFVEMNPGINRVRSAYIPGDWEKLVKLKTLYDPKNIFRFNRNIPPSAK
jgi:FAD/FMN-containing dehydrogenase